MRTLLLFAKQPRPGRVKTRLAASIGDEAACGLYRAFLADLAVLARGGPWRVRWWVDGDIRAFRKLVGTGDEVLRQCAGDLGQRLTAAFEDAFGRDEGPAAAVGSDCPLLTRRHLASLFHAVEQEADAAILPSEDGGYAAIALARPVPQAFTGIPWSTEGVLSATLRALAEAGCRATVLAPSFDVDHEEDLRRLATRLAAAPELAPHTAKRLAASGTRRNGAPR